MFCGQKLDQGSRKNDTCSNENYTSDKLKESTNESNKNRLLRQIECAKPFQDRSGARQYGVLYLADRCDQTPSSRQNQDKPGSFTKRKIKAASKPVNASVL